MSDHSVDKQRPGAWICALALVICLMGCQSQDYRTPPLPPPLPPVAPLPQPVRPTFYVTINQLNLRACPGLDCPKTSALELNAEVEKLGEIENWTQIRVKKDGTIGYVSSRYLSPQPVKVASARQEKTQAGKTPQSHPASCSGGGGGGSRTPKPGAFTSTPPGHVGGDHGSLSPIPGLEVQRCS